MSHLLDKNTIGVLLLIHRLSQSNRPQGRESLVPFAELKLPNVAKHYDALAQFLLDHNFVDGTVHRFTRTVDGAELVRETAEKYSLTVQFYDEYYQAVIHSQAHSLFCERIYGRDLHQQGMTEMAQIHRLLGELKVKAGMMLLDFGCGDGSISEYISDTTQTCVAGIDISDQAIALAQARTQTKRDRLQFYYGDMEQDTIMLPSTKFDCIFAIDSIFFVRNQTNVIQILRDPLNPQGKMGLFAHCLPNVSALETPLAQALDQLKLEYTPCDLSAENNAHWVKKKQTLLELEPMFRAEGNEFLFRNRLAECDGLANVHRYLYLVTAS